MAQTQKNGEFKHYNQAMGYYYSTEEVLEFVNSWEGKVSIPERWIIKNLDWGREVLRNFGK